MNSTEKLQAQYLGFINTPCLDINNSNFHYPQIEIDYLKPIDLSKIDPSQHKRLGKLVEVFFLKNLDQNPQYTNILNNIQIQPDKHHTLGEIDFICQTPEGIRHIELAYKFYLYQPNIKNKTERWVGPNLRDALHLKLNKLQTKQFPRLHHSAFKKELDTHHLCSSEIKQSSHIKTQLYLPLKLKHDKRKPIDLKFISGYYLSYKNIEYLNSFTQFAIPPKEDWLIQPVHNTQWLNFSEIKPHILEQISKKHSPLLWAQNKFTVEKYFITFW